MALSKLALGDRFSSYTAVAGSNFYLWGGQMPDKDFEQRLYSVLHIFNFNKEEWDHKEIRGQQPPGIKFGSCAAEGQYIYCYGGEDCDKDHTGSLFQIDTENLTFTELYCSTKGNPLNPRRTNDSGMAVYNGNIYLFGGKLLYPDQRLNELHMFDVGKSRYDCHLDDCRLCLVTLVWYSSCKSLVNL